MKEHAFDTEHALYYGVNCAIILHELEKYINCGHPDSKIYHGKTALKKLIHEKLIVVDSLNKSNLDRKLWYTISDRGIKELNGGVKIWAI